MLFVTVIGIVMLASTNAYIIQSGDTYCAIAQRMGCPNWESIYNLNGYPILGLRPGDPLTIPSTCTGTSNCVSTSYGDSWSTIAQRYNMDVACLMDFNCNQTLSNTFCLPRNCGPYSSTGTGTGTGTTSSTYVVKSGDTYCAIAQKLGCPTWESVYNLNGIAPNLLQPNNVLNVPSTCAGSQTCKTVSVLAGDTYDSIASRYNVNTTCLMDYNCNWTLSSSLCIPNNCGPYINPNLNGWIGSNFYCDGVILNPVPSFTTCGGLMYSYGSLTTGIVGSTFVCQGKSVSSPPPSGLSNCGGVYYNNGIIANGYVNGNFYCNGVYNPSPNGFTQCGNYLFNNGTLYCGYYNGQFYCNGVYTPTGTGNCCGTYYQYYANKHPCISAYNPTTQSCPQFLSWYQANVNASSTATVQDLVDCNSNFQPGSVCVAPSGPLYV